MDSGQHAGVRRPGIIRRFVNFVVCIAIVLAAAWGIRTFVVEPFEEPKAGDIVVFSDPQVPSRVLVKRIIATEGQTVNLANGYVYVDGVKLSEPYTQGLSYPLSKTASNTSLSFPYTIPAGKVWVMGDNRENSSDSRYFGPVDSDSIFGRALVTYWPINRIGLLN